MTWLLFAVMLVCVAAAWLSIGAMRSASRSARRASESATRAIAYTTYAGDYASIVAEARLADGLPRDGPVKDRR